MSPSLWTYTAMALVLAFAHACALAVKKESHSKDSHLEPPVVQGSVWQFLKHGTHILDRIAFENRNLSPHGIITVKILFWKIYLVSSPQVTQAIQARSKHTGLGWISVLVMANMGGEPKKATKTLFKGVDRADLGDGPGFIHEYHKAEVRDMSLGKYLDAMRKDFVTAWKPFVDRLETSVKDNGAPKDIDMWEYFRHSLTVSVGRSVWGPKSPYSTNPRLWEQFWTFNRSYNILKYLYPWILAYRGAEAREKVVDAFVEYDQNGGFEGASTLAKDRRSVLGGIGLERRDIARMAMSQSVGQFDNAATVSFAVLSYILRDRELLLRIRTEIAKNAIAHDQSGEEYLDVYRIGEDCPLLLSTFHEVLRLIAVGVTVRRIESDYPLKIKSDGTEYLLRKGNIIWGSGVAIHNAPELYPDPNKFVPERFLGVKFPETQMPDIFRAFGGGGNICLGRHFARTIVPGAVGNLLMTFDFEPYDGKLLCVQKREDLMLGHATPNPFGNTIAAVKIRAA